MRKLSDKQSKTHKRAVKLARIHVMAERLLVEVLIDAETQRIHKALGRNSMVLYATKELQLPEPTALMLIGVARKANEVPALRKALSQKRLTPSKASRIVAHINIKNAEEILDFTETHNYREVDYEMARRNPKAAAKDKVKPLAEDVFQVTMTMTKQGTENLSRTQSLMAQKGRNASIGSSVETAITHYLNSQDPVRKAKRADKRAKARKVCVHRVKTDDIPAASKHVANLRDEGRCTHLDPDGNRCNSDRHVHLHHIVLRWMGGSHDPENLTTLCSFHHDLVHQLSFGLEGDMNWIR